MGHTTATARDAHGALMKMTEDGNKAHSWLDE
jgi:hypothetical protein